MNSKKLELIKYIESLSEESASELYDSLTMNNNIFNILLPLATYLQVSYSDEELNNISESISKSLR
jgi:hypothetical protein